MISDKMLGSMSIKRPASMPPSRRIRDRARSFFVRAFLWLALCPVSAAWSSTEVDGGAAPTGASWGVWLGGALALAALLFVVDRLRWRVLRQRILELEDLVEQRTAEALAKQSTLEIQNQRLEINNQIVKMINAPLDLGELLKTILEGAIFLLSAHRAVALVRLQAAGEVYEVAAAAGWRKTSPSGLVLSRSQIEDLHLRNAEEIAPGIWIGGAPGPSPLRYEEEQRGALSKTVLAMRIDLEDDVAGYVLASHVRDADAFAGQDRSVLLDLREHIASAMVKGRMLDELRRLNKTKNEFLGIAAHDLRSPLGGVLGYVDLLLRFLDQERFDISLWRRFLTNIRTTVNDMRALVDKLLDVSAIELGKLDLHIERQRFSTLLAERADLHAQAAASKRIGLDLNLTSADVDVAIDRTRIAEVLDNLVSNAIKFTNPEGSVRVFCESGEKTLDVHVEDTGQGLEEGELGDVFSGKRLSARPTAGEPSTGLGLVIVKKIVEQHGGRAWVESTKGQGSTFSFSLPLAQA